MFLLVIYVVTGTAKPDFVKRSPVDMLNAYRSPVGLAISKAVIIFDPRRTVDDCSATCIRSGLLTIKGKHPGGKVEIPDSPGCEHSSTTPHLPHSAKEELRRFGTFGIGTNSARSHDMHGWSLSGIHYPESTSDRNILRRLDRKFKAGEHYPRPQVQSRIVDGGLQGSLILLGTSFQLRHVPLVSSFGFIGAKFSGLLRVSNGLFPRGPGFPDCFLCSLGRLPGSVGGRLSDASLPNAYAGSDEGAYHEKSRKSLKSLVGFDLISLELMLLSLACLAGDLFLIFRFIENKSSTFKMEGTGFIVLFLLGQATVFIMCARVYGLFGF